MPIYEYLCQKCGFQFEKLQRLSDPPPSKCPECGGKVAQLLSAPAVQFKGTGWYVTDYGRQSSRASAMDGGKAAENKPESKTGSTKPELAKSESKPKHKK